MIDETHRSGRDVPFLNWRHILFTWNDSNDEMALARQIAADLGVDRLCWEITDHPEGAFSRRFRPGEPAIESIKHEIWDDNNLGNAIPGATPRAGIDVLSTVMPGLVATGLVASGFSRKTFNPLPLLARRRTRVSILTRVHNLSTRSFPAQASYGRRLVRLGAQLHDAGGRLIDRDFARAWLPATLNAGAAADVGIGDRRARDERTVSAEVRSCE